MAIDPDKLIKTRIDRQGRLLIPAALREKMGLKPGGHVAMSLDEHGLHVVTTRMTLERIHRELKETLPPGVSLVDELIADRRAEAERETAE